MTIVFPLHVLATIVFLGGLFFAVVVFPPIVVRLKTESASFLWQHLLNRLFVWAWVSMLVILGTGIGMVFLKFGGFSGVPLIHRQNMAVGIPAIILFGYAFFGPWGQYRRTIAHGDWTAATTELMRLRFVIAVSLGLGLVASAVSAVGRYI
jgi:uncharacterized membrane protein